MNNDPAPESGDTNDMASGSGDIHVLTGLHYATGESVAIHMRRGAIVRVDRFESGATDTTASDPMWVGPGFVDLQINGFRGDDFNTRPFDSAAVIRASRALLSQGVTGYCPTIATGSEADMTEALRAAAEACERDELTKRLIAGIHLEGPFISPEDGARGVHGREHVRAPDWPLFERLQRAAGGRIAIVTLSPEWPNSADFIARCVESGVKVAIGHTSASPQHIREAAAAGAAMSTHLGNGAHLTLPRHPNYLWEQLADDGLAASVIADGHHLPDSVLKVIFAVKRERAFVISDASFVSGLPPGEYTTSIGGRVVLTAEGRLHPAGDSRLLAGSAHMQRQAVEHLVARGLTSFGDAWDMCSVRPAAFLGLPSARGLNLQAPADLVVFRRKGPSVHIVKTYKRGHIVYREAAVRPHDHS